MQMSCVSPRQPLTASKLPARTVSMTLTGSCLPDRSHESHLGAVEAEGTSSRAGGTTCLSAVHTPIKTRQQHA